MTTEIMEGRLRPCPSDSEALHKGTKTAVLVPFALATIVAASHLSYLVGQAIGNHIGGML